MDTTNHWKSNTKFHGHVKILTIKPDTFTITKVPIHTVKVGEKTERS